MSDCLFFDFELRVLLAYFGVSGLDIMNKLDKLPHSKEHIIDWIYKHQIEKGLPGKLLERFLSFKSRIL